MSHQVLIPTPLRPYTDNHDAVQVEARTVGEALDVLTTRYHGLRRHLYGDDGKLRSFVNVYLNDDDIRYLDREATALGAADVISIIPSVAGGAAGDRDFHFDVAQTFRSAVARLKACATR